MTHAYQMPLLIVLVASGAAAEPSHAATPSSTLPSSATNEAATFDVAAFETERARLRRQLTAEIIAFDQWLAGGDAASRDQWRRYLHWDRWAEPIVANKDFQAA